MKNKKLWALTLVFLLQYGCSGFHGYQPPAPIYTGRSVTNPYETPQISSYPVDSTTEHRDSEATLQQEPKGLTETVISNDSKAPFNTPVMVPAVVALMSESEQNSQAGDLESAVAVLERALRIDPRNPTLTYKLAELRVKQGKPRLAEDLARKAALLSAGNIELKRKSWLLISEARRMQQNYHGAKEAKLKAESFINP